MTSSGMSKESLFQLEKEAKANVLKSFFQRTTFLTFLTDQ